MEGNIIMFKLALSVTSFVPLYALVSFMYIYILNDTETDDSVKKILKLVLMILIAITLLSCFIVNKYIKSKLSERIAENTVSFNNIREDKKASINYMLTYILPLLSFNSDNVTSFYVIYSNLLILLFIIMNAKAENFFFNIILEMKGYIVCTGSNKNGDTKTLLLKRKKYSNISQNSQVFKFVSFGASNDIFICKDYGSL